VGIFSILLWPHTGQISVDSKMMLFIDFYLAEKNLIFTVAYRQQA